ncbi:MAG TPA: Ig-like domain-containing protein [Kofleriaceae bacterium]|jgi:hypothetical protein|nr:Ig-like domain-containing protein [Kofleriaceae bacterium]
MNRFAIVASLFFACSPVKGTPLIDAEIVDVQSLQIAPASVPELRVGLDAPVQLSVQAMFSDGTKKDVTQYVKWSSSSANVSVDATGLATAVAAGATTITAALGSQSATLAVTSRNAILVSGDEDEIDAVSVPSIDFFDPSITGSNVAPIRSISGSNTGLTTLAYQAFPDLADNELYVAATGNGILVYPLDGSGNIAPLRTIPLGSASTLLGSVVNVALYKGELYVNAETTGDVGAVVVFDRLANGSAATPTRSITGSATTLGTTSFGLLVANDTIYVGGVSGGSNAIVEFPTSGSGNIAPTARIGGSDVPIQEAVGLALVGDELFVGDASSNRLFVIHDGAIVREITGPDTKLEVPAGVTVVGQSLVCVEDIAPRIDIFPLEATGDIEPTSIVGSANQMLDLVQVNAY